MTNIKPGTPQNITPLPWHQASHIHIKAKNGWRVASVNVPSGRVGSWEINPADNAAYIVHACNLHGELVEEYGRAIEHLRSWQELHPEEATTETAAILYVANTLLAKCRGEAS